MKYVQNTKADFFEQSLLFAFFLPKWVTKLHHLQSLQKFLLFPLKDFFRKNCMTKRLGFLEFLSQIAGAFYSSFCAPKGSSLTQKSLRVLEGWVENHWKYQTKGTLKLNWPLHNSFGGWFEVQRVLRKNFLCSYKK